MEIGSKIVTVFGQEGTIVDIQHGGKLEGRYGSKPHNNLVTYTAEFEDGTKTQFTQNLINKFYMEVK